MVDVEAFLVDGMVCIIILAPFLPLSRACKKTEWWDAGMVVCLGQGADFHMAQLMPLPLTISCSSDPDQIGFTFLVSVTRVVPEKIQEGRKMVVSVKN